MGKLFKYEFRKSLFPKLIFLCVTTVLEVVYLIGIAGEFERPTAIGMIGLTFAAVAGIAYMGIESIITLYRDLTTKQSYMLFMTPNSSYKILGAKALENGLAVLIAGAFFGGLAYIDVSLLSHEKPAFAMLMDMVNQMMNSIDPTLKFTVKTFVVILFMTLVSVILRIVLGYFAVVLSCTVLQGKKAAGLIAIGIYIAISLVLGYLSGLLPKMEPVTSMIVNSCISLAACIVFYFLAAWIMDRKLSV